MSKGKRKRRNGIQIVFRGFSGEAWEVPKRKIRTSRKTGSGLEIERMSVTKRGKETMKH